MRLIVTTLAAAVMGTLAENAAGQAPSARDYTLEIPHLAEAPHIDGRLDDAIWRHAAVARDFVQKEPRAGESASEPTEVFVYHTRTVLVIGARLYDSAPRRVVASEFRRDGDLSANDRFEIFLDTFHDRRNAFYFATNAVGVQRDGLIRGEGDALNWDWDGVWQVACSRTEDGWSAEFAIPFATLRFRPAAGGAWGVNFGRLVARTREESYWVPVSRDWGFNAKWRVSEFGTLRGLDQAVPGGRVAVKPYLLGRGEQSDRISRDAWSLKPGADVKVGLGPTLAADLTLNTDFAQVEADQQRVNLTRFPLFYREKREFFLENAGLFQVGERVRPFEPPSTLLFFSRRIGLADDGSIVPLAGGGRLTGKLGAYDVGALNIVSRSTRIGPDEVVPQTNFAALRVKRDVLARSSVGAMVLSKTSSGSTSNHVVAADATLALAPSFSLLGFGAASSTTGLRGGTHAMGLDADFSTDRVGVFGTYMDIGDGFRSEMGFLERTGIRKYRIAPYIARRPEALGIRQVFFGTDHIHITDRSGRLQSQANIPGVVVTFHSGASLLGAWNNAAEGLLEPFPIRSDVEIPAGQYRFNQGTLTYESDASRPVSARVSYTGGGFYHGDLHALTFATVIRPHGRLSVEFEHGRNAVDLPVEGGRFVTNLTIGRAVFAFSPRTFVRALVQSQAGRDVRANVLFRHNYRPGADLFVVWNSERAVGSPSLNDRRELQVKLTLYWVPL